MRIPILILGATVALGACSTFKSADTPTCDGRHRRPANLYGSVLDPARTPAPPGAGTIPNTDAPTDTQTPVLLPAPASAPASQGRCA